MAITRLITYLDYSEFYHVTGTAWFRPPSRYRERKKEKINQIENYTNVKRGPFGISIGKLSDMIHFKEYPSFPHHKFKTSVPHKNHTFSAPKIRQFNTKIPQFHSALTSTPKPFGSTSKTSQFNTPLSSTPKTPQFHTPLSSTQFLSEGCVELRSF